MRRPARGSTAQTSLFDDALEPRIALVSSTQQEQIAAKLGVHLTPSVVPIAPGALARTPAPKHAFEMPEMAENGASGTDLTGLAGLADVRDQVTRLLGTLGDLDRSESGDYWKTDAEETAAREFRRRTADDARHKFGSAFPEIKLQKDLERTLEWGWLLPALELADRFYTGRWQYLLRLMDDGKLTPEQGPIPFLQFEDSPHPATLKMIHKTLDGIPKGGGWQQCWSNHEHFSYFLDWVLFGLGHSGQREAPPEPWGSEGASLRLYQLFQMPALLLWPFDYLGHLMSEAGFGKAQAFYPTPHSICELIARMTYDAAGDERSKTVMDPCVGTGRMLLHASNHSLCLFGMDINPLCVKATLINLALFAPWGYRPLRLTDPHTEKDPASTAAAGPGQREKAAA